LFLWHWSLCHWHTSFRSLLVRSHFLKTTVKIKFHLTGMSNKSNAYLYQTWVHLHWELFIQNLNTRSKLWRQGYTPYIPKKLHVMWDRVSGDNVLFWNVHMTLKTFRLFSIFFTMHVSCSLR
jgi:hypothetical protein